MWLLDIVEHLPDVVGRVGPDVPIEGSCADSRSVAPGDLFVAIRGTSVDGHRFIAEAVRAGASAVIGELPAEAIGGGAGRDFSYVRVLDARRAWGLASAVELGFPSRRLTLIGVTGTDGKTTTVSLVHAVLGAAGFTTGMISTVKALIPAAASLAGRWEEAGTGLHTTTPDPTDVQGYLAKMVERGATHAVLEVTSHGLAQQRVAGCDFDVAVVTNVTHEHLDYHGSLQAYQQAKASLFSGLADAFRKPGVPKITVLNRDDDSYRYLKTHQADRQVTYSVAGFADVSAHDIRLEPDRTRFTLDSPAGRVAIETRLVGAYNVANILAAASVGIGLGVPVEAIAEGVASVAGVPGRMERVDEGQPFLAIVDFAHTPNALRQALGAARGMVDEGARVIAVFGSAGLRDREKRRMMGGIAGELADVVIVTAEDPRTESLEAIVGECAAAAETAGKRMEVDLFAIPDRGQAILRACEMARPGDVVIACGKGHEQSMCFGTTEYPWDDRRAMRLALQGETLDTLPTSERNGARPRHDIGGV
jgi:UDP-N-acetylmuramoyl-L-alanyl-D-glutamate--2,6-diaminopimelate ligase